MDQTSSNVTKLFGPPGTGKTTALLNLLEKTLEEGVPPERVAYMTFTVKAREEAYQRATKRFGFTAKQLPYFRTLHSIAYRQLGLSPSMLVHPPELQEFSELVGFDITGLSGMTESGLTMTNGDKRGDKFMTFDHLRRHRLQTLEEAYRDWREDEDLFSTRHFTRSYNKWKQDEGLIDFTDLLSQVEAPLPVDVVFVDEAQDLSALQWKALNVLSADATTIYIAGDDDQAIFEWAGADPQELLGLKGKVQVLDQSYRVPRTVHELAGKMVKSIKRRQPKQWRPRDVEGKVSWTTEVDHVDFNREGTYLVLYRHHFSGKPVEAQLRSVGMPFGHSKKAMVGGEWANAIILWEQLRKGKAIKTTQMREVYDAMVSGNLLAWNARQLLQNSDRDEVTLETAKEEFGLLTDEPWYTALNRIPGDDVAYIRRAVMKHGAKSLTGDPKVYLSTIHAAKGGEADHVVLLTDVSRRVRDELLRDSDSERRVFYVGLTRARSTLQIVGFHNPLFATL